MGRNERDNSLSLAAATVFGTLIAVETLVGFSERYKFSKEDVIMNALGIGLGLLFEKSNESTICSIFACITGPPVMQNGSVRLMR